VHLQLCPDYTGIELGIGESLLIKAIGESTGRSLQVIKAELKKEGDLGLVATVSDSLCPVVEDEMLKATREELEEYAKDPVQAEASHNSFRLFESKRDRTRCWPLRELRKFRSPTECNPDTCRSLKARKCPSSRSSLPHVRAKRQSILSEV
jgi:hypothetical protein